jgi:tripartite-type tricarboxylate transporter receptor subunit TctC
VRLRHASSLGGRHEYRQFQALAVTTAARSTILPDVPALGETLPDYEASAWYGPGGPKRMPEDGIEKLNKEVNVSIADPKLQAMRARSNGVSIGRAKNQGRSGQAVHQIGKRPASSVEFKGRQLFFATPCRWRLSTVL